MLVCQNCTLWPERCATLKHSNYTIHLEVQTQVSRGKVAVELSSTTVDYFLDNNGGLWYRGSNYYLRLVRRQYLLAVFVDDKKNTAALSFKFKWFILFLEKREESAAWTLTEHLWLNHDFELLLLYSISVNCLFPCHNTKIIWYEKIKTNTFLSKYSMYNLLHIQLFLCLYVSSLASIKHWLTELEVMASLFAAAIHDYEHTGTTNNFHIHTK